MVSTKNDRFSLLLADESSLEERALVRIEDAAFTKRSASGFCERRPGVQGTRGRSPP